MALRAVRLVLSLLLGFAAIGAIDGKMARTTIYPGSADGVEQQGNDGTTEEENSVQVQETPVALVQQEDVSHDGKENAVGQRRHHSGLRQGCPRTVDGTFKSARLKYRKEKKNFDRAKASFHSLRSAERAVSRARKLKKEAYGDYKWAKNYVGEARRKLEKVSIEGSGDFDKVSNNAQSDYDFAKKYLIQMKQSNKKILGGTAGRAYKGSRRKYKKALRAFRSARTKLWKTCPAQRQRAERDIKRKSMRASRRYKKAKNILFKAKVNDGYGVLRQEAQEEQTGYRRATLLERWSKGTLLHNEASLLVDRRESTYRRVDKLYAQKRDGPSGQRYRQAKKKADRARDKFRHWEKLLTVIRSGFR